jgi:hypothetical protein
MGLKEDIELSLERLRVEKEIAQQIERQTKSVGSYLQARKDVKKNAKEIKTLEETIKKITDDINKKKAAGITLSAEEQKLADQTLAKLKQQRDQLVATNKELLSAGSALKSIGNSLISTTKSLLPSLSSVISTVLSLDDKLRDTAATIGLSGAGFDAMKQSTEELRGESVKWAYGLNGGVQLMASLNQETGRAVMLSNEAGAKMFEVARATGMSVEEMGGLAGKMEAFGLGAQQSAEFISTIQANSENMGVNAGKVIKKFQENLGMLNKLNFRGGMNAMAKMAAHSEKFKLSMEFVASVSDKVFKPEGAIEAAAQLQVMGGAMAQLGDPFQLMYQARNAPEELAKSITKAARESAKFNEKTRQFEVSALELDRLRESAKAFGLDYQELVQTAKQAAKIEYFEQFLGGMTEEEKGLITGMTEMTQKGAEITFYDEELKKTQTKLLSELSSTEKKMITERAKSDKQRADQAMSISKVWQSIQDALMLVGVEVLQPIADFLKSTEGTKWLNNIRDTIIGFATSVRNFMSDLNWEEIKANLKSFWEKLVWIGTWWKEILVGVLILRFSGIIKGLFSLGGAVGKFFLGLFSSTSGIGKFFTNMFSKGGTAVGGTGVGGGGPMNATQTLAQGKASKASGMGSMMKGLGNAAQILAVGAALMMVAKSLDIFADAMIKLKEVPTGLLIGVGIGLLVFVTALGILGKSGIGEVGVAIMLAVGAALLMIGGAVWLVSAGISMVVDSFTSMFSVIGPDNISSLLLLGPALMLASLGIMALAGSLYVMGLALSNPFGLLGLIGLALAAESLKVAFGGVNAEGITKAVDAVNSVNKDNVDALKSLSMWLAFTGKNIKIEFGEIHVDGEIGLRGQGGAKADSDLLNDPIFLRELKKVIAEHTYRDKKGGR